MKSSILREDWSFLLLLGLFLVCLSSANTFLQIAGDSLFIAHIGVAKLPLMYIISALVLAFMAIAIIPVIDRMERTKIYNITAGALALGLISCRVLIDFNFNGIYYVIYVITYILEAILFLGFWLIASDLCHTRQAKRIFPLILGASLTAGIIAAFLAQTLARSIHTKNILLISGLLCGVSIIFSQRISKFLSTNWQGPRQSAKRREPGVVISKEISRIKRLQLDLRIIWQSNLVRIISISFILYTVLSFILEYEFNRASSLHFTVAGSVMTDRLTAFFGQVKGFIAIIAIAMQFLLSHKLINTLGVCRTYIIMPFVFFLGFLGLSIAPIPIFYAALAARFTHKTVYGSWYRSSSELLYNAIPNEKRGRVKAFHATIMEPLGVALAGGILILAQHFSVALALGLSLVYIIVVGLRLKKNYLASLINMLKEKSGGLWDSMSGFFGQYGTREMVNYLSNALGDKDPHVRTFACEILSGMKRKDIFPLLAKHYAIEEDSHVKARILKILPLFEGEVLNLLKGALKDRDIYVRKNAIEALGEIGDKETLKTITPFLDDTSFIVQAQTIVSSWKIGGERGPLKDRIIQLFKNEDNDAMFAAIFVAGNIPIPESLNYLKSCLDLDSLKKMGTIPNFFERAAIKALGKTEQKEAANYLIKLLARRDNRLSFLISSTLASMGKIALEPIKESLSRGDIYFRHFLLKALEGMGKNVVGHKTLKEIIPRDIRESYYHNYLIVKLNALKHKKATLLLKDALLEENNKAQLNAITSLKLLDDNSERMNIVSRNIQHPDAFVRSDAIEALENIGDSNLVTPLIGLLEGRDSEEKFPALTTSEILKELVKSRHRWIRATAIFGIGELKLKEFKDTIAGLLKDKDALIRTNAREALAKL